MLFQVAYIHVPVAGALRDALAPTCPQPNNMRAAYQKRNPGYTSLESLLGTSNFSFGNPPRSGASSKSFRKQHKKTDSTESQRSSVYVSPKPQSAFRGMMLLWKWECSALVVSLVIFIASIVILREYENKALSQWKAPISINTVIAIITTIFKGSLLIPISNGIHIHSHFS